MRCGRKRGVGSMKSYASSSSEVRGVVGTPSLDAPSEVEEEAERAGERGVSAPNMSNASSTENV